MLRGRLWWVLAVALALGISGAVRVTAQENKSEAAAPKPAGAYRVQFVFSEMQDGKTVNSRSYEMLAQAGQLNKIRAGARMPVSSPGGANFQYLDIGMNIDCRVEDRDGGIGLNITADSSSFTFPETDKAIYAPGQPIVQQFRSQVDTVVSPGKPTLVSSMDDPSSKRRFQLEVTASRVR